MNATRVDPCGCDEALDLRRQVDALVVERDALKAKASEMRAAMLGLHKMLTRWSNCPCKACSECIEEVCPAWDNACAVFEIPSDDLLDSEEVEEMTAEHDYHDSPPPDPQDEAYAAGWEAGAEAQRETIEKLRELARELVAHHPMQFMPSCEPCRQIRDKARALGVEVGR